MLRYIFWSETRAYMAVLMGAAITIVMLIFMLEMYPNRVVNFVIFGGAVAVFAFCLWPVRNQATVGEISWMKAMIPHHSIAILTSERAKIDDPRVRELADEIIKAQRKEIAVMKALIADLEARK